MLSSRALAAAALSAIAVAAHAQTALPPVVRITFADAIQRAQEKNTTVAGAAAGILRADALVRQARAATLFQLSGSVTTTTLNEAVEFAGQTVTPRSQVGASLTASMPIGAAAWARKAQALDAREIADLNVADVKRQVALAAADAYLAVIVQHRIVEANTIARDTAKAHFDLATELEQKGAGSRLNALRAQQQYSTDSGLVEAAGLALYRAQEALGVLIVADGPADAADEPDFAAPLAAEAPASPPLFRTDLKLFAAQQDAAERIVRDSSKDWWPTVEALFQPSTVYPAQLFLPQNTWRFTTQTTIPLFESGQRAATKGQRQADLEQSRATLARWDRAELERAAV